MLVFLLTFLTFATIIAIMSIGVIMGRKPIKGSCGGLNSLGMGNGCEICGGDQNKCETTQQETRLTEEQKQLGYEVK